MPVCRCNLARYRARQTQVDKSFPKYIEHCHNTFDQEVLFNEKIGADHVADSAGGSHAEARARPRNRRRLGLCSCRALSAPHCHSALALD